MDPFLKQVIKKMQIFETVPNCLPEMFWIYEKENVLIEV